MTEKQRIEERMRKEEKRFRTAVTCVLIACAFIGVAAVAFMLVFGSHMLGQFNDLMSAIIRSLQ